MKILIVEDDPFLSKAYEIILSKEGFEVEVAHDGLQGIELARNAQHDLILLDMLMPELGGMEFLKLYNQKVEHPNTKIIVFSNMSTPESTEEAKALGAVEYLTKARMSPKEMVGVIKEVAARVSDDGYAMPDTP